MKEIFEIEIRNYNFLHDILIKRCNILSVYYGTVTASFIGPKIWDALPNNCKDATSLKSFKVNLKRWIPENCPCRLCKTHSTGRVPATLLKSFKVHLKRWIPENYPCRLCKAYSTCRVPLTIHFKGSSKTQLNLQLRY